MKTSAVLLCLLFFASNLLAGPQEPEEATVSKMTKPPQKDYLPAT